MGKFLIVGKFNIHVDVANYSTSSKLLLLLESFELIQHVRGTTHLDCHTLNLIISRSSDNVVSDCVVSTLIEDHFAIHTSIRAHQSIPPQKRITYQELDRIDTDKFI